MTLLTDNKIKEIVKIVKSDKVLDVGGSMMQHKMIKVDTLVDIIRPEEAPYKTSKLTAKKFVRVDITKEKFPFKDNEFDVCLCTHTLEDLSDPTNAIDEMSRVAKRGLIITPSMGYDLVFSKFDITNWLIGSRRVPGLAHHKWFFVKEGERLRIIPKNYPLLYSWKYHMTKWLGDKEMVHTWKGNINYKKVDDLSIHKLISEYRKYFEKNSKLMKKSKALFFIDNPVNIIKAYMKVVLRRGRGYKYVGKIHK
ncbi:methyltransferase domain-containing protein [Patescibacteria group bacterium]